MVYLAINDVYKQQNTTTEVSCQSTSKVDNSQMQAL